MRRWLAALALIGCVVVGLEESRAQKPVDSPDAASPAEAFVKRMMSFDKNNNGKLTRDEVDVRLQALFDRADADHDGIVTREELLAVYAKESPALTSRGPGGDRGPGGFGGPDGPGGPPRIGEILPGPAQTMLKLTEDQKHQLDALQKESDVALRKILSSEQNQQLEDMRNRVSGPRRGFGPPPE